MDYSRNKSRKPKNFIFKNLKKNSNSSSEALNYIKRCHKIYIRVILDTTIWENDKFVLNKNKTKMWYIINKEIGNSWKSDPSIVLNIGKDKITNLQKVTYAKFLLY